MAQKTEVPSSQQGRLLANTPLLRAEEDAGALLRAVQEKIQKAKSLRVGITLDFPLAKSREPAIAFSGEVRTNGQNQWLVDFVTTKGDGLEVQFRGSCDGLIVGMNGFGGEVGKADNAERYARQLRDWCATSFVPIVYSLASGNIDQGVDSLPTVSEVTFCGREKVGGVDACVVKYFLIYPDNSTAQVTAWIDPVKMRPLKRELGYRPPAIVETITSFELDAETPNSAFVTPDPTEANKVVARMKSLGHAQLTTFRDALSAFVMDEGRYPTTAEGLEALVHKPLGAKNWKGPYLKGGELPKDPWGNAYAYQFPGMLDPARFDLFSRDFDEKYNLPLERMKYLLVADTHKGAIDTATRDFTNSIGMGFKRIPAGSFIMGSNDDGPAEKPAKQRTITRPFYLGIYEVTQAQYERVVNRNSSPFKTPSHPVEQVSWEDAVKFCRQLSELAEEKSAGRVYRLPTEAEWEYAARAGSTGKWCCGDDEGQLGEFAWYLSSSGRNLGRGRVGKFDWYLTNSGSTTHPVGQKKANAWGLFDMHGNVQEWCQDWWDAGYYVRAPDEDPLNSEPGLARVARGGRFEIFAYYCRSAVRDAFRPTLRDPSFGFRVALVQSNQPSNK